MNYTKPELFPSGSAVDAIQSQVKGDYNFPDSTGSSDHRPTNGAYEADE